MPETTDYAILRNKPVARFRYRGSHSKPVRRELYLTEVRRNAITGYETREGNTIRSIDEAVIKTFSRDKIVDLERFSLKNC